MATLADLENLCVQLYNPMPSSNDVAGKLSGLKNPMQIPTLRAIVQQSTNQFALFFAGQTLKDMFAKKWNEIDNEEKVKLRKCCKSDHSQIISFSGADWLNVESRRV